MWSAYFWSIQDLNMSAPLINWREMPFVRITLPLAVGILSAVLAPGNGAVEFGVGLLTLLAGMGLAGMGAQRIAFQRRWVFGVLLSLCLIGIGRLLMVWADERQAKDHFSPQLLEKNTVSAEIIQIQPRSERLRLQLKVLAIGEGPLDLKPARGHLLAYLHTDASAGAINIGDRLLFKAAIQPAPGPKNPKAFDYRRYLHFKNLHYQCFVGEGEWRLAKRAEGWSLVRQTAAARQYCIGVLRRHLPSPNEFGVATALVLGYRDETPETLRDAYAATGATHVLAVSGLHVGIVQMVIAFFLRFWGGKGREHRVSKMCITLAGVWGFALLTGAPSSALRAAAMFSFLTIGQHMKRTVNTYNTIAASAFFLLCLNPRLLFDVGFQLSYLAVLGIVFFHPRIYRLWYIENRIGDYIWQLAALSLAATLTTFPLSLLYFHQFPVYFWLSGLIAVPLAGVILGLGMLLFAVQAIPWVGLAAGKALYAVIWFMNACIFAIQQLPGSRISGIWVGAPTALLLYGVIIAVAVAVSSRKFRWILVALSLGVLVAGVHLYEAWKAHQRREIVLYHTRRQTVIDCFDGRQVFTLTGSPVTEGEQRFALQNYRWYCRSREQGAWLLNESPPQHDRWLYRNGLLRFHHVRMAIVNRPLPGGRPGKVTTDYLLIRDNPRFSLKELVSGWDISSGLVLIDASNSPRRAGRWLAECESLGLSCYDVESKGAWVLDIKQKH